MRTALLATFSGGPLDGQRLTLEGGTTAYVVRAYSRQPMLDMVTVLITEHTYRRTNDWRKDGSVTFLYRGEH